MQQLLFDLSVVDVLTFAQPFSVYYKKGSKTKYFVRKKKQNVENF